MKTEEQLQIDKLEEIIGIYERASNGYLSDQVDDESFNRFCKLEEEVKAYFNKLKETKV